MSPAPVVAVAAIVGTKGALKILEHVLVERAAGRAAQTRQAQLDNERRTHELEQRLDRVVRTLPPSARREYERGRQTMERDHGPDRGR